MRLDAFTLIPAVLAVKDYFCESSSTYAEFRPVMDQLSNITDPQRIFQLGVAVKEQFPNLVRVDRPRFCPVLVFLVELVDMVILLNSNDVSTQAINLPFINANLNTTVGLFADPTFVSDLLSRQQGSFALSLMTAIRLVASFLRPRVANNPDFATGCAVSYRYKSSSITAVETQWDNLIRYGQVFPIASRMRDLSISRIRCIEDSIVGIASVARSLKITTSPAADDLTAMYSLIHSLMGQAGGIGKLLGASQPVVDMLFAIVSVGHSLGDIAYIDPIVKNRKSHYSTKQLKSSAPVFGFNCDASATTNLCEVSRVVESFTVSNFKPKEMPSRFRSEFNFLQSINANWFTSLLKDAWGYRIVSALVSVRERTQSTPMYRTECTDAEFTTFVSRYVDDADFRATQQPSELVAMAIRNLITVHPDCTVSIAASFALAQDALVRVDSKSNDQVFKNDLAMLMEMEWQTIAGEKFDFLLFNEIQLFRLMQVTWGRIAGLQRDMS